MQTFNIKNISIQYPQNKNLVSLFVGVFLGIFLSIFQPFNLDNVEIEKRYFVALGYAAIAYITMYISHLVFNKKFIKQSIQFIDLSLFYIVSCFFIGLISSIYNDIIFRKVFFTIDSFYKFQYYIFVLCLIPFILLLLIWSNRMKNIQLKQNLDKTNLGNKKITLHADNPVNNFKVDLTKLVYISAANNYVDIYYLNENQLNHKLIRNSLKNIESDLKPYPNFFRCHKGYIVDLNRAKRINKIENGYKLWLNIDNISIPVSRSKVNEVREKIKIYIS